MNTYENEMMAMLRQGMSMDEVMNKMRTQLANAQAQIRAEEEEARRKQAEAEAKLAAEAKKKADNEAMAKTLVDMCNRAMEGKLTSADVAYVQQLYAKQKYPEHARMFAQMFDADEVDSTIKMAMGTMNALTPLVHLAGAKDWNEVLDELDTKSIKDAHIQANAKVDEDLKNLQDMFSLVFGQATPAQKPERKVIPKNDDTILRDFVNSIKK